MKISVVIPLYNEAESLQLLYEQLTEQLKPWQGAYEIIFIDDGSGDDSFKTLSDIHAQDSDHVKVLQFRRNFGKSAGLAAGFDEAEGEIVFTLDADLQDDPVEIPRFIEMIDQGYDLVVGWKYPRRDPLSKTLPSRLYNGAIRVMTGVEVHENNSGFKAMRREVAKELKLYGEMHRYIPVLSHWRGYRVGEIKVNHHPRRFGRSKFGLNRFWRGLFDFITVYFLTQFTRRPLHFFGLFGLSALTVGGLLFVYLTAIWFTGESIGQRPLLTLSVLLIIIGGQFFSFGLLAEMLSFGIYSREQEYSIRRKLD